MLSGVTKSLIVFGTTVLSVSLLTACAYLSSEPPPTSYSYPVSTAIIPESDLESLLASDDTTETSEETSETSFTVETEPYVNPFGDYALEDDYTSTGYFTVYRKGWPNVAIWYGFDNPYSIQTLQDEVYDKTSVQDSSLTLSDVNYFQSNNLIVETFVEEANCFQDALAIDDPDFSLEAIRAVLSSQDLRFGIDEIPASFLMEQFPRFYYDAFEYGDEFACMDFESIGIIDVSYYESVKDIPDSDYIDYVIFKSCVYYNASRLNFVYGNPYGAGFIGQVRDASTGKNVLVPTDSQAEEMQADINNIPGLENISIYTPETPEEFYADYGYYPEDLLDMNDGTVNSYAAFEEYYNSLPESDQNELYAPILFN